MSEEFNFEAIKETIKTYREKTFQSSPELRIFSKEEAVDFVKRRGFIFFWPIKDQHLPSLWIAAAGDRPVPNNHDDPGHITWDWKDSLLDKKRWYYSKLLNRRNTILSFEAATNFYALSPNYGDFKYDYLDQYKAGLMTSEAKEVYETLLNKGPLDSLELRKEARLSNTKYNSRFQRALDTLQMELKVLPIGIANTGAWHYSFIYEIMPRYYPELPETAYKINAKDARDWILNRYFDSVGFCSQRNIQKLFKWDKKNTLASISRLLERKYIRHITDGSNNEFFIKSSLL